jgi:Ni/Co efflux regulator RcnB
MKKIVSMLIGLSLVLGTCAFAQDAPKKDDTKKEKKGKKGGKKKAEDKKAEQK